MRVVRVPAALDTPATSVSVRSTVPSASETIGVSGVVGTNP